MRALNSRVASRSFRAVWPLSVESMLVFGPITVIAAAITPSCEKTGAEIEMI